LPGENALVPELLLGFLANALDMYEGMFQQKKPHEKFGQDLQDNKEV